MPLLQLREDCTRAGLSCTETLVKGVENLPPLLKSHPVVSRGCAEAIEHPCEPGCFRALITVVFEVDVVDDLRHRFQRRMERSKIVAGYEHLKRAEVSLVSVLSFVHVEPQFRFGVLVA